jgi:hypothetical protein
VVYSFEGLVPPFAGPLQAVGFGPSGSPPWAVLWHYPGGWQVARSCFGARSEQSVPPMGCAGSLWPGCVSVVYVHLLVLANVPVSSQPIPVRRPRLDRPRPMSTWSRK